jgi:S1-C subfamily serine protease
VGLTLVSRPLDQADAKPIGYGLWAAELSAAVSSQLGLSDHNGAVLTRIEPDSPASRAGLERGDIVRGVDRAAIANVDEMKSRLSAAHGRHVLAVEREGTLYLTALEP